jgi:hypothetical protein
MVAADFHVPLFHKVYSGHLHDSVEFRSITAELAGIRETLIVYPRRQGQRRFPTVTCLSRMNPLQRRLFSVLDLARVPGHLAALLLRPVDEHRLEAADPDRHGHGAAERGAGDAEGRVREPSLRTSTAEVGLAASRRRLLC